MLSILGEYQKEIWSVGTVIFGFLLNRLFRMKPRLNYSVAHASNILVSEPLVDPEGKQISDRQLVRMASITVENSGLQAAKGIEVTFNWKPHILNIIPARHFDEAVGAFDRYSLKLDSLAPNERFTIEIMAINAELPGMTVVRSEDAVARQITMAPQRVWPSWFLRIVAGLMILGAATAVYLSATVIQLVASQTGHVSDIPPENHAN